MHTPERQAKKFLRSKDYARAKEAIRQVGLDVRKIPRYKPVHS
jgi:hypothetical protein